MVVFSLTRWSSLFPTGFLVSRRTPDTPSSRTISRTGLLPSSAVLSNTILLSFLMNYGVLHPRAITNSGLGCSDFARHYFRNRFYFLFLRVIRCFSSPGSLRYTYLFSIRYRNITYGEFPHSDICGSLLICSSPQLFAACRVLLRRHVPRHPPVCSL